MKFDSPYIAPILTVDAVVFQLANNQLQVLLVKRGQEPFRGSWALPGGYNAAGEKTTEALHNIVKRKAGLDVEADLAYIEQLYTFDTVARDPRGHAVSVVYMGCGRELEPQGGSESVTFMPVDTLPELAYDHAEIIEYARQRLASKLTYTNAIFALLPPLFTLTQLQTGYEAVFGHELDKRNFRKKFLSLDMIHPTNETWREGAHRPAKLYRFNQHTLQALQRSFD